jgi:hypothetical protein
MGKVGDGIGPRERSFIYRYPNKLSCLIVYDVDDAKSSCLIDFYVKEEEKHMYL